MKSVNEILEYFNSVSSGNYKENVVRMGIPEHNSLGVSIQEIRKLAKRLVKSNGLARELWNTDIHEAKILSVLLMDIYTVKPKWAISLMDDVQSWDLCDHLCKNLLFYLPEYEDLIRAWQNDHRLYHKRAAFSLIATSMVHDKELSLKNIERYLKIIENHVADSRPHVRKAVLWSLREIGKKDLICLEKAKVVAKGLSLTNDKNKQWVGKNALKEFSKLISVKERKRLISVHSKVARKSSKG